MTISSPLGKISTTVSRKPRLSVEAEPQLAVRPLLVLERLDSERLVRGLYRVLGQHPVFVGAAVDLHAA
jgi:hypothetical protein